MKRNITPLVALFTLILVGSFSAVRAQSVENRPINKAYWSTGIDGYILSTAIDNTPSGFGSHSVGTPRFTAFFHISANVNYDLSQHVGIFTGFGIKNIGFIEKYNNPDSTAKRRVYTFGFPLGIKLGNIKNGSFLIAGGGVDFPFNYKEKGFISRGHKEKFNEWFSSRTPAVMPYVFIGAHLRPIMAVKLQYYPGNFMNPNYSETVNNVKTTPYAGYDVNLVMLTFGFDINYRPRN